jgi:prepilin-type N-terminal cleavage/methylation domain-containing protein
MKPGEKGFTLIELTVTVAIVALIAAGANMSIFQVLKGTERSNDHMTAVNQVQNAGYWVSRDTQMAENVTVDNLTPPAFLVLAWTEEDTGVGHQVTYTLEAMPGSGLKRLIRNHSIDGGAANTALVAQYIDPDPGMTKCQFINGTLTLTVTASISSRSQTKTETRVYKIAPRPS